MATHTFVHFEHPEAADLAALTSVRFDLSSTLRLCEYLEEQSAASANGWPDREITDAFSTAILVRYSRAFLSGVRRGLGEEALATLTDEQRSHHLRLRAFRDKHIAHSVNAFEDTRVQARYCLERVSDEGITSVSAAHYRVFGLSGQDVLDMKNLCTSLLSYVDEKIKDEECRLLAVLRAMPVQEVLSRPSAPLTGPDPHKIAARRKRP